MKIELIAEYILKSWKFCKTEYFFYRPINGKFNNARPRETLNIKERRETYMSNHISVLSPR